MRGPVARTTRPARGGARLLMAALAAVAIAAMATSPAAADDPADIVVKKSPLKPEVRPGEPAGFMIAVVNDGTGDALNVKLRDVLPGGATLAWFEAPDRPECSITDDEAGNDVLLCDVGTLAPGAFFVVRVKAFVGQCGRLDNLATAFAEREPPVNRGNNQATASVTVVCGV